MRTLADTTPAPDFTSVRADGQTLRTVPDLFAFGLTRNTTGVCASTKRGGSWHATSPKAMQAQVRRLALGLHALGVEPGDRVALHAESSTQWLIVDQALAAMGAISVPLYPTQPGEQIQYILSNAGVCAYIGSTGELFAAVEPHLDDLPALDLLVGLRGSFHPSMHTFADVLAEGLAVEQQYPERFEAWRAAVAPDDLYSFIYTSGTTGKPKGVMLTHRNLVSNVLASLERMPFSPEKHRGHRVLSYLPLSHVFERMLSLLYLYIGFPIYFVEHFEEFLDDVQTVKPVHFSTVPRLLEKVFDSVRAKAHQLTGFQKSIGTWAVDLATAYDVDRRQSLAEQAQHAMADRLVFSEIRALFGGNLVGITSGGAALAPKIMNFINALGIFCGQGYGMTETSPVITVYHPKHLKAGSVGPPLRNVRVRIADDGEIQTKGPHVMQGYYKMPGKTAEVFTDDGWLCTGDIGRMDREGHLYITDRKKALFKLSTGKYVAPQPIESSLASHPMVDQVVVVGAGRKYCGALIVPNVEALHADGLIAEDAALPDALEGQAVQEAIQNAIGETNKGLSPWEQVKQFRLLPQPFTISSGELTPKMSQRRSVIHERYAPEIDAIYEAH